MLQFDARIIGNEPVAEAWRRLVLSWEAEAPEPGQFLTLRASGFSDPLLRRPFAFAGSSRAQAGGAAEGATVSVVYQVRGGATRLLADLAPGAKIDVLGPLGRGFPAPGKGETPIIAGGGIGLGPLLFLAERLAAGSSAGIHGAPLVVLGFRTAALLPRLELPAGAAICTDDGSTGFRGTPVDWISRALPAGRGETSEGRVHIYGCGPAPMLAALAKLAADRLWRASLSAEQWMACGVGACMGCALPRAKGYEGAEGLPRADGKAYLRACADGPVFDGAEVDWGARP